jgi:TldD protein
MKDPLSIAEEVLLAPAELQHTQLASLMNTLTSSHIDYADLYFQNTFFETWSLEDSQIKGGSYNIDKGVGVRAVSGEKTGFAYSDDIVWTSLLEACHAAKSISNLNKVVKTSKWETKKTPSVYPSVNPLNSMANKDKLALLTQIDEYARAEDPRVQQVNASLSGCYEVILVLNNEGRMVADIRPLVSVHVSVIVEENGKRESARSGGGTRGPYDYFFEKDRAKHYAKEAVREALVNLNAVDAPAGTMPVVLGPGWPGVLLHEAVGHGLEGDFNRKKLSAFSGRLGEKVASEGVTVVDNGAIEGRRGSLSIDDEGTPTQCTVLIENGVLVNYMQDSLNARLMKMSPTGNCRRESYAHIPLPRMTNTYMLEGAYPPEEIIRSVKKGLYAVNFGGGQVDITSGKFVFSASEAYLIENGKVTSPVKGATLIGNGPDVMQQVSMIGNDLSLDAGIGVCGKEGQSVPVGVGQPTLKINALTVGGTNSQ